MPRLAAISVLFVLLAAACGDGTGDDTGSGGRAGGDVPGSGGTGAGAGANGSGADGAGAGDGSGGLGGAGSGGDGTGGTVEPAVCPATYTNPLIWEDLPDLEIIRVEDTYYYTASTFHYSPGAPVLRSYDLVHWEYAGHSVPVLDFENAYSLIGGQHYVDGIWASTLQYRASNETFYWMGCMHGGGGGYVYTSKSAAGPWTKQAASYCPHDVGMLIDPDTDKMYLASGNGTINVAELNAAGTAQVSSQAVFTTPDSLPGPLEGSRMYKINGDYYIMVTQYAYGEYVLRSTNGPFGPYELRPVAVQTPYAGAAGSGASPHQGGLIETQNGDWYYVGFNDSYPAGRIPVMAPVEWVDGWPEVQLVDGKWGGEYPFPDLPCGSNKVSAPPNPDTFATAALDHSWEWNHNPDNTKWSAGSGLTLDTATVTTNLYAARNTLTRRIAGPVSIATIELDYADMANGDVAGLAALRDQSAWIGVKKAANGTTRVVVTTGIAQSTSDWSTTNQGSEAASADISGGKIWLRVEADVRTNSGGGFAKFSYSTDGTTFTPLGSNFTMTKNWQFFLGYRFGIFNYATTALGGSVTVESFEVTKP